MRILRLSLFAVAATPLLLVAQATTATPAAPAMPTRADTAAVSPAADPARGMDAEIRVALFELLGNQYVPALSRLQYLEKSPVSLASSGSTDAALRGRNDLAFLLAQSYYRLGMDDAFRATAEPLLASGNTRYTGLLRAQLLIDAYRRGDAARATQYAHDLDQSGMRGLAALVSGLVAYQQGNYAAARQGFAGAVSAGAPYAPYATYMDALAQVRADTANTTAGLAQLTQLADNASGEFGDQVRLTAAELAYEAGHWDQAAELAGRIDPKSGLAPRAQLTRAWALYKADHIQEAGDAFHAVAQNFPQLQERDEARLMYAQTLLQLGRTAEAQKLFKSVSDSATGEVHALQDSAGARMQEAARALVSARAAGLLFVTDPADGKTVALDDGAGSDGRVLAAVVGDTITPMPAVSAPNVVSLSDLQQRFTQANVAAGSDGTNRVLYAPVSATSNRQAYAQGSQSLYAADVQVATARFRLQQQLDAQAHQLAMLQAWQGLVGTERAHLAALADTLRGAQDSLQRVSAHLAAAADRIRRMFAAQVNETRSLAAENQAVLDSLRASIGATGGDEAAMLDQEAQTTAAYTQVANLVEQGINGAIKHNPTVAFADSVAAHGAKTATLLAQAQGAIDTTYALVNGEIDRLRQETPEAQQMRATLAAAEQQRQSVEQGLIGVVQQELAARAGEMIADLRKNTEAAQFGSASALFFQALDASKPATGTQTGEVPASGSGVPAVASTLSQQK